MCAVWYVHVYTNTSINYEEVQVPPSLQSRVTSARVTAHWGPDGDACLMPIANREPISDAPTPDSRYTSVKCTYSRGCAVVGLRVVSFCLHIFEHKSPRHAYIIICKNVLIFLKKLCLNGPGTTCKVLSKTLVRYAPARSSHSFLVYNETEPLFLCRLARPQKKKQTRALRAGHRGDGVAALRVVLCMVAHDHELPRTCQRRACSAGAHTPPPSRARSRVERLNKSTPLRRLEALCSGGPPWTSGCDHSREHPRARPTHAPPTPPPTAPHRPPLRRFRVAAGQVALDACEGGVASFTLELFA